MNKSGPQSPVSVASKASSETSETPSISDVPNSTRKTIKKSKDPKKDEERPPWRPVSVAPPSKADKNSLLKAKLLDASRRALRAQKQTTVYTQTDAIPTKLMREAAINVQNDLIETKDKEITTDGSISIKPSDGSFVLTHSVSQMTDDLVLLDVETQTAMPKCNLFFNRFLNTGKLGKEKENDVKTCDAMLLEQISELKKIDERLKMKPLSFQDVKEDTEDENEDSLDYIDKKKSSYSDFIGCLEKENEIQPNLLSTPTRLAWDNLDFSDEEDDLPKLPRRTIGEGDSPWNNFKNLIIGQRLSNMTLSPIPIRRPRLNKKSVTWSDPHHLSAVSELITEASALVNIFDQVALILGPDIKLNKLPPKEDYSLPSLKWDPLLTRSCDILEEKLKELRPVKLREIKKLSPELLQYKENLGK